MDSIDVQPSRAGLEDMAARPVSGYGRGVAFRSDLAPVPGFVGPVGDGLDMDGAGLSVGQDTQPPYTSTPIHPQPSETDRTLRHLGVLITELGKHIGDSVTARLLSDRDNTNDQRCAQACGTTVDIVQLSMALKSDGKEPPIFRGEASDKCSVHEWVDLMSVYLKRKNVTIESQSDEIMARLLGRARDVVRIGLRSDPSLSAEDKPDAIYAILKQLSDQSYSCMPLADFF